MKCNSCSNDKPEICFYFYESKNRFSSWCKECFSAKRKERYKQNSAAEKTNAATNRKINKKYYKEYNKNYAIKNREAIRNNQRKRYKENPAKTTEYKKEYYIKNREYLLFLKAKNRARKHSRDFNIELSDIILTSSCPVLLTPYDLTGKNRWLSPSLDRIDNSKGYVKNNVMVISYRANSLKKDGTIEEFKKILSFLKATNTRPIQHSTDKLYKQKARRLLNLAKHSAKTRGLNYFLSKSEKDILCNRIPLKCPILGIDITVGSKRNNNSLSIDRIDNNKGYELDNLMFCSYRANSLKSNGSIEEFEALVKFLIK
jgi:hypothetical protein